MEAAEGGTLFLDEIGEIKPALQAKLLRFLEEKQFERIGENRTRRADVRIVAATNRDLDPDVRSGRFREDLLFRLNVIEVRVPPLRERTEDIVRLARRFLEFFAREAGRGAAELRPRPKRRSRLPVARQRARAAQRDRASGHPLAVRASGWRRCPNGSLRTRRAGQARRRLHAGGHRTRAHPAGAPARATIEEAARILGIDASTLWRKRRSTRGHEPWGGSSADRRVVTQARGGARRAGCRGETDRENR